jgi:hypothetical protein
MAKKKLIRLRPAETVEILFILKLCNSAATIIRGPPPQMLYSSNYCGLHDEYMTISGVTELWVQ